MADYQIFPDDSSLLKEGNYKFLVVSKTDNGKDALIIFADVKTRHAIQLYAWMKDNALIEAYTFGGGRMSVSFKEKIMNISLFGASCDYLFTSKILVEEIIEKSKLSEVRYDLDLPTHVKEEPQLTSLKKSLLHMA